MNYGSFQEQTLAKPGDLDLGVDIDGTTIESVLHVDLEILVRFTGGFGTYGLGEDRVEIPPGCEDGELTFEHIDVNWNMNSHANRRVFSSVTSLLDLWRREEAVLHLCMCDTRISMLIKDEEIWIPLP
jgi:hypothetical protein